MPYFARQVGRAKGIGKFVHWDQGGGPKKAGLGPQINVSTWGRRVIARRTNNCCCDPIELTSVQMSLPRMTTPTLDPPSGEQSPQIGSNIEWNQWTPGGGESEGGGYVGPPRNNIDASGVIRSNNQIYAIFTFNKPISATSPPYKYTPVLPKGTQLELIGLKKVDQSVTNSPLGAPVKVTTINPPGIDYYIRESKLASVTQIPGGTEVSTFLETNKRLTDGSRFLIDNEVVTGEGTKSKFNLNSSKARILPDMQSGLNNADPSYVSVPPATPYYLGAPDQVSIQTYGAFNRRLDWESRGGFAPSKALNKVSPGGNGAGGGNTVEVWDFTGGTTESSSWATNHFLGNIFGVYTKARGRADNQYDLSGTSATFDDTSNRYISPNFSALNIRLVQSNRPQGSGSTATTRVENYSADAAYISTGKVSWLGNEHALFINITSIMQIMLKNPTANAVPQDVSGCNNRTVPNGLGWTGNAYPNNIPDTTGALSHADGRFGIGGAPPMIKYFAGNPLQMISQTMSGAGPANAPQVIRPFKAIVDDPSSCATDWRNSYYNSQGKYATLPPDAGLQLTNNVQKAGPWQIGTIDSTTISGANLPNENAVPSYTDSTWNQIGYTRLFNGEMLLYNAVTIDSGGMYRDTATAPGGNLFPNAVGFETNTFRGNQLDQTLQNSSYHILYYGHVVEKMRQLTYAGFSSYIIKDVLQSKYNCGNDGFDGPIADIVIPSGDRRITTTDNTTEAGLLTFDSNAPSYPLPAIPPTVNPTPINPNPPLSPISGGDDTTSPDDGGGTIVGGDDTISPSDDGGVDGTIGDSSSGGGISGDGGSGTIVGGGGSSGGISGDGGSGTIVGGL
jgi:hypothetical protein